MPIDKKLLEILVCPVTKQPVVVLDAARRERLNQMLARGEVYTVDGTPRREPLTQALITRNGSIVYPVEDDIPIMLEAQGIATVQLGDFDSAASG